MKKKLSTLVTVSVLVLGLGACEQQSALNKAPGTYEKTTSSTDASGTTTDRKNSTQVSEDQYGNKKAVIKSKTTKDPKGLLNKTTTSESKQVIEEKQE